VPDATVARCFEDRRDAVAATYCPLDVPPGLIESGERVRSGKAVLQFDTKLNAVVAAIYCEVLHLGGIERRTHNGSNLVTEVEQ
jgi:hypothetical protein